jgi:hypothetical protein
MTCDKCGKDLAVGAWPFCPHEEGRNAIIPDEVPGGFWVENGFDEPQKFYSKSEHRAALDAKGLEIRAKWAGPLDKIMTRWDAPSAKTLEDARILLGRGREARQSAHEQMAKIRAEFPITVTEVKA